MSAESDRTDDLWADMTPDSLRGKAAAADKAAAESWERSDTDGFVSQWAHGLTAHLHRTQADIVEAGGTHKFLALFDLDGNYVPAQTVEGHWGKRWHLLAASGFGTGKFLPYMPKRRATLASKGYVEGYVERPAEAFMNGSGHGLSGRAWVDIRPTDLPWHTPRAIITTDRWADRPGDYLDATGMLIHRADGSVPEEDERSPYGRCDQCGAPCDEQGCTADRSHEEVQS